MLRLVGERAILIPCLYIRLCLLHLAKWFAKISLPITILPGTHLKNVRYYSGNLSLSVDSSGGAVGIGCGGPDGDVAGKIVEYDGGAGMPDFGVEEAANDIALEVKPPTGAPPGDEVGKEAEHCHRWGLHIRLVPVQNLADVEEWPLAQFVPADDDWASRRRSRMLPTQR